MEIIEVKNGSSPYRIRPNLYPSKIRDQLVLAQLYTGGKPGFTRSNKDKKENCIYLYYKVQSHIGKMGTEYEAWCDIKPKSIINEGDLFLESLIKSIFFLL